MNNKFNEDLKNLELPYTMEVGGSDTLLITFAGISGAVGLYPFEFFKITRSFNVDKIFIRDLDQSWYHNGLKGISSSIDGTAEYLRNIIDKHKYKKVVCLGNSMGGYAAILIGELIKADIVLSFAPQTFLDSKNREIYKDNRWAEQISSLPKEIKTEYMDLSIFFSNINKKTKVNIYYSLDERIDIEHATRLKEFKNIDLYSYEDGGHQLVQLLRKNGDLYRILRNTLTSITIDRIVSIFKDIEIGFNEKEAVLRYNISNSLFFKYKNKYKNIMNLQGTILKRFFDKIFIQVFDENDMFVIVDDKIINRPIYSLDLCKQWFENNPKKLQMFGTYLYFGDENYLLHFEVGTKNLHIGFVKYSDENNKFKVIAMSNEDFNIILDKYVSYEDKKLEFRNWGNIWCSIDCGEVYDLSYKNQCDILVDLKKSDLYRLSFSKIIKNIIWGK
ncbi:alpha/beta hydrolase family protein [Sulfurimonas sp.]